MKSRGAGEVSKSSDWLNLLYCIILLLWIILIHKVFTEYQVSVNLISWVIKIIEISIVKLLRSGLW